MIALVQSKLFIPAPWTELTAAQRMRYTHVDRALQATQGCTAPSYRMLEGFSFTANESVAVRPEISGVVQCRSACAHSMSAEIVAAVRANEEKFYVDGVSVYQLASKIRALFFREAEPLRTFEVTFSHIPWLRIRPPQPTDPVFHPIPKSHAIPALFEAINAYLVLLSAHPFSDGNGRTARVMLNVYLKHCYGNKFSHLPLSELLRKSHGLYEELLATGHITGNYAPVAHHLLDLIAAYVDFTNERPAETRRDDLEKAEAALAGYTSAADQCTLDMNETPPFLISMRNVADRPMEAASRTRLMLITALIEDLKETASVKYVMTTLTTITAGETCECRAITFFLFTDRKEDLILRARELRSKYRRMINIEFATITGDMAMDAKILINVADAYRDEIKTNDDCVVILDDFC